VPLTAVLGGADAHPHHRVVWQYNPPRLGNDLSVQVSESKSMFTISQTPDPLNFLLNLLYSYCIDPAGLSTWISPSVYNRGCFATTPPDVVRNAQSFSRRDRPVILDPPKI